MASKILMPNPTTNHSFGQVSLPKTNTKTTNQYLLPFSGKSVNNKPSLIMSINKMAKTSSTSSSSDLARLWREVQGCNDWEHLVSPLHPLLRQEIIRYGEFVTACYKAFDLDPNSKRYLHCKYAKTNMLTQVGMADSGYRVTKYIYAAPDIPVLIQNGDSSPRWIGYVAVSSDETTVKKLGRRDIVITFRGTVTNQEWVANFMSSLTPARLDPHNPQQEVKVESGFLSLYSSDETEHNRFGLGSCREQLLSEVSRLLNMYKGEELSISIAGHSMGSALAILLAYDISELGLNRLNPNSEIPVTVLSFGGPRVGNSGFKNRCEELGVKVLRIVNVNDPITKLPGVFLNENFRVLGGRYEFPWSCSCYAHVGVELVLDFFNMQNPTCVHDLETYISLLKLPKSVGIDQEDQKVDFWERAKELMMNAEIDVSVLKNAASNLVNSAQFQSNGLILINDSILAWMNFIVLCIFFSGYMENFTQI